MAQIHFERWHQTARFHNPLKGGQLDAQQIEIRLDPLTGHQSTLNPALRDKASVLFPATDWEYMTRKAEETKPQCFLCNGKWRRTTPTYDSRILPEGRLERGEAALFPNLFPLAATHAVVMVGNEHIRSLDAFPASLLYDAFMVSLEFIRRCYAFDPTMLYFTINANYLFPAGASVSHPHLQILGSPHPGTHLRMLLEKSRAYRERQGTCYWSDWLEAERRTGERYVGQIGGCHWTTAYAPLGANEVNAVWPGAGHFLEWGESDVAGLAEGLSHILRGYHDMKHSTFNFSCFSGPLDRACEEFRCFMRLINRQNVVPDYRADDYYFQKLLEGEIVVHEPEGLASFFRGYF